MKRKFAIIFALFFLNSSLAFTFDLIKSDANQKDAKYLNKVLKQEAKEKYERKQLNYTPSGYMTKDEYESLSEYKDKTTEKIEIPKVNRSDMKYVPNPTYKIVRYNNPPGSAELNISKSIYELRQFNGQGIVSPDYSIMVYPVVYYYPNKSSMAGDLFVIPLDEKEAPLNKILKANVKKRLADPILSTEKSIDNESAFRTLTPVDFSGDGNKLLVKEKIGSSLDGIWKTNMIVYDFENNTSYELVELRDAIVYYWKEYKGINLDDIRWDIYPLGFAKNSTSTVLAYAYAYTGKKPIFLGIWSVDVYGEQSQLVTFDPSYVQVSQNGFKIVQDGVVSRTIVESEQKAQKKIEKNEAKELKQQKKADFKEMKQEYKANLKELNDSFKEKSSDYNSLQKIKGSTSLNDIPQTYKEERIKQLEKEIKQDERKLQKINKNIEKLSK